MGFTHLHLHSEYSLLDGAARIKDVVAKAKDIGMTSLAITDHGVMFGVIDFYKECKAQGIKPILGCEVYTARKSRLTKDPDKDKQQGHLVLLAKNDQGYKNLMKIVSKGFIDGFYYKPRIDKDILREHSEGIIALSACLAGDIQRKLLNRDYHGAKQEALDLLDIFGEGNFYLELQDQGLEEQAILLPDMKKINEETGIPFVATNDVHYVDQKDATAHDVLICVQTASTVDDTNRMSFPNDQFYLKSEQEMRGIFAGIPEACDNTEKIAEKCEVEIEFGKMHLPDFQCPNGMAPKEYLRQLTKDGIEERYGQEANSKVLLDRLEYELSTIETMGYVEYFLIVWDFINYAKKNGIMVGPGRGSAAGSLVSYVLKITDIDPIKYNLIFERFLNPERISMPDIDIDFCYERRQEVIDYVVAKYGEDKVAQIITFGTMKAKAAIRDVGRALNVSYAETDAIAKAVPFELGMTLDKALKANPELLIKYKADENTKKVIDFAKALEKMPRHASTHAAGVVISKESIDHYVPLYLAEKGISTQFTMTTIEELGLLKMDFLGLRNLTVIRDAIDLIEQNHNEKINLEKMEYDDPKVFKLIADGNTQGVFQLESLGMTQFMKNLRPDCFEDIVAGISLYRPGPMGSIPLYIENKKNPANIEYVDPSLEPILSVSYGCLVYQEQVMQIVRDLAGYTYGRSDLVRRAMGKKKMDVMLQEKEHFIHGKLKEGANKNNYTENDIEIKGCIRNGVSEEAAEEIFNQMVTFAEYAFNKSHAAAYAVIGYETAYLKQYYPIEFMAALMTSVMGDSAQVAKYIRNAKEMGIEVLPPDVNESGKKFTATNGKIRFGLLGVKNVGENAIDAIVKSREAKGRPKTLADFIGNLDIQFVNKKAIESLIKAGALDTINENRAQSLAGYESLLESAQNSMRKNIAGQMSLFQLNAEEMDLGNANKTMVDVVPFSKDVRIAMEKEMVGVYITGHPLDDYQQAIKNIVTITADDLEHLGNPEETVNYQKETGFKDGQKVRIAGIVSHIRTLITKTNKMMAFVQLEDLYGTTEIIIFNKIYDKVANLIKEDSIVVVSGSLNFREEEAPKILADNIRILEKEEGYSPEESIDVEKKSSDKEGEFLIKLKCVANMTYTEITALLKEHPGNCPVRIYVEGQGKKVQKELYINPTEEFKLAAIELLGLSNIKIEPQ